MSAIGSKLKLVLCQKRKFIEIRLNQRFSLKADPTQNRQLRLSKNSIQHRIAGKGNQCVDYLFLVLKYHRFLDINDPTNSVDHCDLREFLKEPGRSNAI
jgi:hypothetical protein